jgi:erythromycin esterase-like protein
MIEQRSIAEEWQAVAKPLKDAGDLDELVAACGDARVVLLGEASHGTSEFYVWRAALSRRLIQEKGFTIVAVEGDWPSCYELNRYVKGLSNGERDAKDVLRRAFNRWPAWMWANWEIAAYADWLRSYNASIPAAKRIGFYGLDMYSLWESMEEVIRFLEKRSPEEAEAAKEALQCFQPYGRDEQQYGLMASIVGEHCRDEVAQLLRDIRSNQSLYEEDPEGAFNAEQNARVAMHAEAYYRAMMGGGPESWNIRDRHMTETLEQLLAFGGPEAKAIVWEHNTHIGDARATDMADEGMVNVGQLLRERMQPEEVYAVGFAAHRGTVIAGRRWGSPHAAMRVPEAMRGSWEDYMHRAGAFDQVALLGAGAGGSGLAMQAALGHRAIGVVYHPEHEQGNYVPTVLPARYDAVVFIDDSHALHPLGEEPEAAADGALGVEPPDLYPWGF